MKYLIKRIIDLLISIPAIVILFPLWVIVSILIKVDSPGPAFYTHNRVGKDGKEFPCFKFRSMKVNSDPNKLVSDSDDDRVTKLGHFLRSSSFDETPQLINVFLGHMSAVGPRPALPSQVEKFTSEQKDKLLVKPGLTGWTQVNGRNSIKYEKRMELDCWYANNWNVLLDLKILLKTPFVLLDVKKIYDVK